MQRARPRGTYRLIRLNRTFGVRFWNHRPRSVYGIQSRNAAGSLALRKGQGERCGILL